MEPHVRVLQLGQKDTVSETVVSATEVEFLVQDDVVGTTVRPPETQPGPKDRERPLAPRGK